MMKKHILTLFMTAVLLAGCGSAGNTAAPAEEPAAPEETAAPEPAESEAPAEKETEGGTLVVYFSATGTTKGVAEKIAAVTGGDLFELTAAEPYSDADLDWHDSSSRSTAEQNDPSVRPALQDAPASLDGYDIIYLGFPIWWGEEPRIMDTFAESVSFEGKTVIPFCTSGSSPIGRSGENLEQLAGSGTWLKGQRFSGSVSEDELKSWIDGLQ